VGVAYSAISAYLNGRRLPDADTLRKVAERTDASLDWLLLGDGNDEPRYRGQSRSRTELEAEVAAYVAREVSRALSASKSAPILTPASSELRVDGARVLREAVHRETDALAAWAAEVSERLAALEASVEIVRTPPPEPPGAGVLAWAESERAHADRNDPDGTDLLVPRPAVYAPALASRVAQVKHEKAEQHRAFADSLVASAAVMARVLRQPNTAA
jgi:transcriptional regulator with XRE-family HTH domain